MKERINKQLKYIKKAISYIKPYKKTAFLIMAFSLLSSIFDGISISTIIPIFQSISSQNTSLSLPIPGLNYILQSFNSYPKNELITILLLTAASMVVIKSIFNYFNSLSIQKVSHIIKCDLQNKLFSALVDSNIKYYNSIKTGELVSGINSYTKSIASVIINLLALITKFSRLIIYIAILFLISWKLSLISIVLLSIFIPITKHLLAKIKNINIRITQESERLTSSLVETFLSIPTIKIFSAENIEKNKFKKTTSQITDLNYKESQYQGLVPLISESLIIILISISFIVSIKINNVDIVLILPIIIAYLYIFLRSFQEASGILKIVSGMFQSTAGFSYYEQLLKNASEEEEENGHITYKKINKSIDIKNVFLEYEDATIIKNLNLSVPRGNFVAIVGPTGSGKTTIINLITGLLKPTKGTIEVDGVDLNQINIKSWRNKIGFISQETFIFDDSIYNNILYGNPKATQKDVKKAAKIANLSSFIEKLPNKYNTRLGERGNILSGGQKQRIAIARAIIRNPEILILDEATSSLDAKTESIIQNALEKAMRNRTVIAIAHRLSTIKRADKIIVIDKGQVIEEGSHDILVKNNQLYKKYYELQFKN